MKVLVAIAVDDDEGVAVAYGGDAQLDRTSIAAEAETNIADAGFSRDRLLWSEIEIPPPPPPIQAEAKEE